MRSERPAAATRAREYSHCSCEMVVVVTRAAAPPGGVDGETAPAGADLQQVVAGGEAQPVADPVELAHRGGLQIVVPGLEDGAGVGHGRVEEELKEAVPEVVMGVDVAAVGGACRALRAGPSRHLAGGVEGSGQPVDAVDVVSQQGQQTGEVRRAPVAPHVGLTQPVATRRRRHAPHPLIVDGQVGASAAVAEDGRPGILADRERSPAQGRAEGQDGAPRQAVPAREVTARCSCDIGGCGSSWGGA